MALVVIVFAALVASTQERAHTQMQERRDRENGSSQRRFAPSNDALTAYLEASAALLSRSGPDAAKPYLTDTERLQTFLFDDKGRALKRPAPSVSQPEDNSAATLKGLVQRAIRSGNLERESSEGRILAARRASFAGKTYVVAGTTSGGRFGPRGGRGGDRRRQDGPPGGPPGGPPFRWYVWWLFADSQTQILRLLALLATTGLVCYGLVRNLTTPIVQLRGAAQRLARGDLSARVGAKLTKRRDELGGLGSDFDLMAERLQSLMKAQNRLIADISHELRSPLARLSVALGLVRTTAGDESVEDLDRIELEAERLNFMIGQLLTISRLESGEPMTQTAPVDIARLVAEIGDDADFEASSRECAVRVESSCECAVSGNESLLRSAIENVVRNAVRYTKDDTTVQISLTCEHDATGTDWAVIAVRDYGEGVPEESLSELFRPFYRIADARDRQSGGVGLGLAITERAVHLHGGQVVARNAESGGLLVEIRLPCQMGEATK